MTQLNPRTKRLNDLYHRFITGKAVQDVRNLKLFMEAICSQPAAATSISKLVASPDGMNALENALMSDSTLAFLSGPLTELLEYVQAPELTTVCGGAVLRQVLTKIVGASVTFNAFIEAANNQALNERSLAAFAWFLLQLLSLPAEQAAKHVPLVQKASVQRSLLQSPSHELREQGHHIVRIAQALAASPTSDNSDPDSQDSKPGGRHNNDFAEIHRISIYPTSQELGVADVYLPTVDVVEKRASTPEGFAIHVDAQFRLLREDMLRDLREEISNKAQAKRRRNPVVINELALTGVHCNHRQPFAITLNCATGIPHFHKKKFEDCKKFLQGNKRFLGHGALAYLTVAKAFVTLGTILREDDLLLRKGTICLQIPTVELTDVLLRLRNAGQSITLIQLDTALFSYEPVLKQLQESRELSLEDEIVSWQHGAVIRGPGYAMRANGQRLLDELSRDYRIDLQSYLDLAQVTQLDKAQVSCFLAAFQQRLAVMQGPPGTGKSFMGSLVAKTIYRCTNEKILVVTYTHHALDDFLDSLLNLGIAEADIVRLGDARKATPRTKSLALFEQNSGHRFTKDQYRLKTQYEAEVIKSGNAVESAFDTFVKSTITKKEMLDYLEFLEDDRPFFSAFEVPETENGMTQVGKRGARMSKFYLLDRWCANQNAGVFDKQRGLPYRSVWSLEPAVRWRLRGQWEQAVFQDRLAAIQEPGSRYNAALGQVASVKLEKDLSTMRAKRIIACTTTAAAKYSTALRAISPGVVIVEEAGEILESHVLTALCPTTKQLILIGDHKQLRPKVNYELSVEKGTGYDLNRSMFERLILKGFPHQVLFSQHRMRPEISALIRELTYPDLQDAEKTKGRQDLRGFSDNIIFVNHSKQESELVEGRELRDASATSSKQNLFEAQMTLKCIRYLGQQGYRTDNMVVLTPYLGQLRLLQDELGQENDPVLNDLDSFDLVRAGLMPAATASLNKPRLRISTVDNYQGEEADVVVVSLTRSNEAGDIGFMSSPERLNVLLSRARDAMILIGNAEHFMSSRKGGELWTRLFNLLKGGNHIYDGFPVRCERHPARTALLSEPSMFDAHCPDGGCDEPCDKILRCQLHKCPDKCHNIQDHSKMTCRAPVQSKCPKGHIQRRQCHQDAPKSCKQCTAEEAKARKAAEQKLKEQEAQQAHLTRMATLELEIQAIRDKADIEQAERLRHAAFSQKKQDLETAKRLATAQPSPKLAPNVAATDIARPPTSAQPPQAPKEAHDIDKNQETSNTPNEPTFKVSSEAKERWGRQKQFQGASNDAIDTLMEMTGLETVKAKMLDIKAKVETFSLQGTDLTKERFGMTMLGNPGTGKTTVARIYGKFLSSVKAIPGEEFVEASGSSLANDGVPGLKKKLEDLSKAGGGVFFLDEAYQLASGNSYGGKAVLDYLLAEIEEQRGRIAFVLAGYQKDMEKFFEHNPGFPSRVPNQLIFADYSDEELLTMLASMIRKKYKGKAKLAGGPYGLYTRIVVRRQGRRRGTDGYGNARDLENVWSRVAERQASRLAQERDQGQTSDVLYFHSRDLIGPEPSAAIKNSKAWKKLHELVGLKEVKNAIQVLLEGIQLNYKRELEEKEPIQASLNRLLLGSPGTGKTSVAKLYGTILADLGLLSKGEMVVKTPADFVGSVLGESEKNTKAILKATEGKVLVIDEAYGLAPSTGSIGGKAGGDPYKTAVVDTIVAEVQSVPGEDRCVLLLGYRDQMEQMLKDANPGLSRRFPVKSAFQFADFDDVELRKILEYKLKDQVLDATDEAKDVAISVLARARDRPNFGNAGEVENLLSRAKESWQTRSRGDQSSSDVVFGPEDFDAEHDRLGTSQAQVEELFADIVGLESLQEKLRGWQKTAVNLKARGREPREFIPFNFVFKGPPGTGKTTVARRIASFYYQIGILPSEEYADCSASDLVAPYAGQTAAKTREVLRSALGKVLFIDEAYRLQDGAYGKEALDEIVDCLTKPDFLGKLVVIIAGYTDDMKDLLRVNAGLASRFPEEVFFEAMQPHQCISLLQRLLVKEGMKVPAALGDKKSLGHQNLIQAFSLLIALPSFGNGRDVTTLAKKIAAKAIQDADPSAPTISVSIEAIRQAVCTMISEQSARAVVKSKPAVPSDQVQMKAFPPAEQARPQPTTATITTQEILEDEDHDMAESSPEPIPDQISGRDAGVSDEVWQQLQADTVRQQERETEALAEIQRQQQAVDELRKREEALQNAIQRLEEEATRRRASEDAKAKAEEDDYRRRLEQARIRAVQLKRERDEAETRRRALQEAEARRRQQDQQIQKKLQSIGNCAAGFRWIPQPNGYRCAGGFHFVDNAALGI